MKKQLIRLTEGDLHNIIQEAVNNILTELDWRTYDAAERAAFEKGNNSPTHAERAVKYNQMDKFGKAKIDRQNQQYDGINSNNFDAFSDRPKYKTMGTNNKMEFSTNPTKDSKETSRDKQLRGAAQIARHQRGGDEYDMERKKWINKD